MTMFVVTFSLVLGVLNVLWTGTRGEPQLSCVLTESCLLPCSFQPGDDIVIHWLKLPNDIPVHSYYNKGDQLLYQNQAFKGRTSLFQNQIPIGNASLLLNRVQFEDEARYKCYTSTIRGNKEFYINVKVQAPILKVHLDQVGDKITCSSEGIYSEPELIWSTNSEFTIPARNATVHQNEQMLYNISSSLDLKDVGTDVVYSCTVRTSTNMKKATLSKQNSMTGSNTYTIDCAGFKPSKMNVIWRFNHNQVIVDQGGVISEGWRSYVERVTETGALMLQNLSPSQNGVFTCESNQDDATYFQNTEFEFIQDTSKEIIIGTVIAVIIVVAAAIGVYLFKQKKRKENEEQRTNRTDDAESMSLSKNNGTEIMDQNRDL